MQIKIKIAAVVGALWGDRLGALWGIPTKGHATRNDFVNDIVNDARADAIFATLKAIVDDETSTISSTISLRVAGPLDSNRPFAKKVTAKMQFQQAYSSLTIRND